jgi:hypothetical protein
MKTAMIGLACLMFSALLAGKPNGNPIPPGTTVKLVALDPVSSATLKRGSRVRFRVWRDVVVHDSVMIPAGTAIDAIVSKVHPASKELHRVGSIRLRLDDLNAGGYRIRLTHNDDFAPVNIKHRHSMARKVSENIGLGAAFVALSPILIPMGLAMTESGGKPNGVDVVLKPCFHAEVYVRSAMRIRSLQAGPLASAVGSGGSECANSSESLEFDEAFLEAITSEWLRID